MWQLVIRCYKENKLLIDVANKCGNWLLELEKAWHNIHRKCQNNVAVLTFVLWNFADVVEVIWCLKKIKKSISRPLSWLRKTSISSSSYGKGNLGKTHKEVNLNIWSEIYVKLSAPNLGKREKDLYFSAFFLL